MPGVKRTSLICSGVLLIPVQVCPQAELMQLLEAFNAADVTHSQSTIEI